MPLKGRNCSHEKVYFSKMSSSGWNKLSEGENTEFGETNFRAAAVRPLVLKPSRIPSELTPVAINNNISNVAEGVNKFMHLLKGGFRRS